MPQRIGIGWDLHRLEADSSAAAAVPIGGVAIPCPYRVIAHSDGDVVLHAISDALLGAVAAGDLGEHFPDTDPAHQGRSSSWFLARVLTLPELAPWQLVNVDVNVIAQTPRLAGHKLAIREQLARIMAVEISQVSIKARTHEGVDAIGHKEALAAQAVVLLER